MHSGDHRHDDGDSGQGSFTDLFSEEFWDQQYRSSSNVWSGHPNRQLTAEAAGLPPGEALDAGCGEGAGVSEGGALLIVGHSPADLHTTAARPQLSDLFFTADEVTATLDPLLWMVEVGETRPREARDPDGHPITVYDEVIVARRT